MKKLEIEKTKPTFIISTFKTDIIKVGLVFSISNFFIAKTSLANNWRSFSSSYLALDSYQAWQCTFASNCRRLLGGFVKFFTIIIITFNVVLCYVSGCQLDDFVFQSGPNFANWKCKVVEMCKVEKILKGSLDSIPSLSPSVKIQIMDKKVCLRC